MVILGQMALSQPHWRILVNNNCVVEQISDNLFRCKNCGFEYKKKFSKNCTGTSGQTIGVQTTGVQPYQCIHTGELLETLNTKNCNCASRGTEITIHHCNLHNQQCGLLRLLKYAKRKELLDKGILDCMECHNRFDQQENTENEQKGV
jgi:hypothetical protein